MNSEEYMKRALELAGKANPSPNPRVGAVLVKNGRIVGEGFHKKRGLPHAEMEAFSDADEDPRGAELYVTLEPCCHRKKLTPPCTDAIISKGISKVYVAAEDPNPMVSGKGIKKLRKNGIEVNLGLMKNQAEELNSGYSKWIRTGLPLVMLKMAATADGKTAAPDGSSKWISAKESRILVRKWRSESDAVMVGGETARKDNPSLLPGEKSLSVPYRVIVSGSLNLSPDLKLFGYKDGKTIVVTLEDAPEEKAESLSKYAEIIRCGRGKVDLKILMKVLGKKGITSILLEGGSGLAGSAFDSRIIDRVAFFIAPKILGGEDSKTLVGGIGIPKISEAVSLQDMKGKRCGRDFLLTARLDGGF